ncbi:hypothetical protein JXB41_05140 [Candidatus Woesearchaeota archaeon]|nr:hypothetical protein [Candidatus Woesearchaeota archaeon]
MNSNKCSLGITIKLICLLFLINSCVPSREGETYIIDGIWIEDNPDIPCEEVLPSSKLKGTSWEGEPVYTYCCEGKTYGTRSGFPGSALFTKNQMESLDEECYSLWDYNRYSRQLGTTPDCMYCVVGLKGKCARDFNVQTVFEYATGQVDFVYVYDYSCEEIYSNNKATLEKLGLSSYCCPDGSWEDDRVIGPTYPYGKETPDCTCCCIGPHEGCPPSSDQEKTKIPITEKTDTTPSESSAGGSPESSTEEPGVTSALEIPIVTNLKPWEHIVEDSLMTSLFGNWIEGELLPGNCESCLEKQYEIEGEEFIYPTHPNNNEYSQPFFGLCYYRVQLAKGLKSKILSFEDTDIPTNIKSKSRIEFLDDFEKIISPLTAMTLPLPLLTINGDLITFSASETYDREGNFKELTSQGEFKVSTITHRQQRDGLFMTPEIMPYDFGLEEDMISGVNHEQITDLASKIELINTGKYTALNPDGTINPYITESDVLSSIGGLVIIENTLYLMNGKEFILHKFADYPVMQFSWIITHETWSKIENTIIYGKESYNEPLRNLWVIPTFIVDPGNDLPLEIWITGSYPLRSNYYGLFVDYITKIHYPKREYPDLKIGHLDQTITAPIIMRQDGNTIGFGPWGEYIEEEGGVFYLSDQRFKELFPHKNSEERKTYWYKGTSFYNSKVVVIQYH